MTDWSDWVKGATEEQRRFERNPNWSYKEMKTFREQVASIIEKHHYPKQEVSEEEIVDEIVKVFEKFIKEVK